AEQAEDAERQHQQRDLEPRSDHDALHGRDRTQGPTCAIGDNDCVPKDPLDMLQPGERVVWTGRPSRYRELRRIDLVVVVIGAFWVCVGARSLRDFALPALLFLLLGTYALTARFLVRMVSVRQARYLISDRRLVLTGGLTGQAVVTADLSRLPNPVYTHQVD